jgi:hypothetical protein
MRREEKRVRKTCRWLAWCRYSFFLLPKGKNYNGTKLAIHMFFSLFFLLISQHLYKLRTQNSFYLTLKLSCQSDFSVCFLIFVCFLHQSISIVFIVSIFLTVSLFLTFLVDYLIIHFYRFIGWKLNNRLNDHQFSGSKYWKMSSPSLLLD